MLSKCANPTCTESFRYLHEGRIFSAILEDKGVVPGADGSPETPRRVERYWLCDSCARSMTLVLHDDRVVLRPIPLPPALGVSPAAGKYQAA
jgi:hypothetical protein